MSRYLRIWRRLLDEGLALAWVPPKRIVVKLLSADSPAERRRIIGRSWRSITRACITQWSPSMNPN